jgi:hypothetical protein
MGTYVKSGVRARMAKIAPEECDKQATESDEDEEESIGVRCGRCCVWFVTNHIDLPVFIISFLILYLSVNKCCYCVFMVAIISASMCMRFPILNATLWSAIVVLYLHKDWNLSFGDVKIVWNRAT